MINFYSYYNRKGLDNEQYAEQISKMMLSCLTWNPDAKNKLDPIKHIILKDAMYAYLYVTLVTHKRCPKAEPYIMQDPYRAYQYARDIIKGRWPEAEPVIMSTPSRAYVYAHHVLQVRWLEAEPLIMTDGYWWTRYCHLFGIQTGDSV